MQKLKCVVIDDEELARQLILSHIEKVDFLEAINDFENPIEAIPLIKSSSIDVIFLDIQMPEIKGTDFARLLGNKIQVIFTTAYSEYALEGFDLNAVDYLLKPITFDRFLQSTQKLKLTSAPSQEIEGDNHITIKSGYDLYKVSFSSIIYIESDSEYVIYHTGDKKIMSNQSLKELLTRLPKEQFMRIHRSYIINTQFATALKGKNLHLGDATVLPISNTYYEDVKDTIF